MAFPVLSRSTDGECPECLDDLSDPFLALGLDDDDASVYAVVHCTVSIWPWSDANERLGNRDVARDTRIHHDAGVSFELDYCQPTGSRSDSRKAGRIELRVARDCDEEKTRPVRRRMCGRAGGETTCMSLPTPTSFHTAHTTSPIFSSLFRISPQPHALAYAHSEYTKTPLSPSPSKILRYPQLMLS